MTNADARHFDSYREQTRVKHRILEQYLGAFFTALKPDNRAMGYIDAFAGQGRYKGESGDVDGSPLLTVKLLAGNPDLCRCVRTYFVESDDGRFASLSAALASLPETGALAATPVLRKQTFSQFMDEWRSAAALRPARPAPLFLFVDPCGVEGVRMSDVAHVLRQPQSEVFVFFNYDGVNRIAGAAANSGSSSTLVDLLGSADRVRSLCASLSGADSPDTREQQIMSAYKAALQQDGRAPYALAYRVESDQRRVTSHYFLHATKDPLGFKIMKHVMWEATRQSTGEGGLELLQASNAGPGLFLRADLHAQERQILAELQRGRQRVRVFATDWVERPADLFSEKAYKQCLLRMEAEGKVQVWSKDGTKPAPASSRRTTRGQATLGDDYWVSLPL